MRERGPLAAGTDVCGPCDLLATGDLKSLHEHKYTRDRAGRMDRRPPQPAAGDRSLAG